MHIHHGFDMGAERFDRGRAEGQVRHKMAIHHIHMDPICALRLNRADFSAEIRKIGRKD